MPESLANGVAAFLAIGVPAIAIVAMFLVRRMLSFREKKLELEARILEAKAARPIARDDRLEQRVRVLERIATDKGIDVADEIERLRLTEN